MTSLGFDTVLVNNRIYDEDSILQLFNTLSVHDVRNFIFLSDFDITVNSFSLEFEKIKSFKAFLSKLAPRGVHTYVYYNTFFDKGLVHNKDFNRLYALKKKSSLFINMPLLSKAVYEELAADINYMLYRKSARPLCTGFDLNLETSDMSVCEHLLACKGLSFGFELNYIFSKDKRPLLAEIVKNKTFFIPTITRPVIEYKDIIHSAEEVLNDIGKRDYYQLCASINRCASTFGV